MIGIIYGAQNECVTINQVNCERGLPLVGFLVPHQICVFK
jgi:hypothetical protein